MTVDVAGSLRRGKSTIGDVDILCSDKEGAELLVGYQGVDRVIEKGPTRTSVFLKNGIQVDARVVGKEEYGVPCSTSPGRRSTTSSYATSRSREAGS